MERRSSPLPLPRRTTALLYVGAVLLVLCLCTSLISSAASGVEPRQTPVGPDPEGQHKSLDVQPSQGSGHSSLSTGSANKYAIVVGINEYDDQEIPSLHCAVNDARSFYAFLTKKMGFEEGNIFIMTSDRKGNGAPRRGNVAVALGEIVNVIKPGGTFILFFSGHGINVGGESFLLTQDAYARNRVSLEETALKVTKVRDYIARMRAARILLVIDACRTDPGGRKGDERNLMTGEFAKSLIVNAVTEEGGSPVRVAATLFSCSQGESSYEWLEKDRGFFSYYLIKGLEGEAADGTGKVTLNSLESYVSQKVNNTVKVQRAQSQTPWMERSGSNPGAWVIAGPSAHGPQARERPSDSLDSATAPAEDGLTKSPEKPLLELAQEAFNAEHYADPPGNNAIELARQQLAKDPEDAGARSLESKARESYERLASRAMEENDIFGALDRYERLAALYPNRQEYEEKMEPLKVMEQCVGEWAGHVSIFIFSAPGRAIVRRDGTLTIFDNNNQPDEGRWTCTNLKERSFNCEFKSGDWFSLTMSADGRRMEGHRKDGARVVITKVQPKQQENDL
jgi:hypothetical protein